MKSYDFAIIGACQAGRTAALRIKELQPEASLLLVNGEDRLPYKRTQLSKKLAAGYGKDDFAFQSADWYARQGIDLINGEPVVQIDSEKKSLILTSSAEYKWGKLLLATGAVPRSLSIPGSEHALHLRTAEDTEDIRRRLERCRRVIVIGQGVEGVELAEQCRMMGRDVLLTGKESRLIPKHLDDKLSAKLDALLTDKGITLVYNSSLREIQKNENQLTLQTGDASYDADLILASVGIEGNPVLARDLGIYGGKGIAADSFCRTGQADIYAAGDAVESQETWPYGLWHWAEYQGSVAAENMAGGSAELQNRPVRLKCEPFGQFFFSMAMSEVPYCDEEKTYLDRDDAYLRIYSRKGQSRAAQMWGFGKKESRFLEQGIREKRPATELAADFIALFY